MRNIVWKITTTIIITFILLPRLNAQNKCTTEAEESMNQSRLQSIRLRLYSSEAFKNFIKSQQGVANRNTPESHVAFGWPMRASSAYDDVPNYYVTSNYVDHNSATNPNDDRDPAVIDEYNCGNRTYDSHRGTDISIWPFWWRMMDNNYVYAVAAAPGIVAYVEDNNANENNCACAVGANNNEVWVMHADSSITEYKHIRTNSVPVLEDQVVEQGQILAIIGSSGCSSNPHLHFQVFDKNDNLIDPYAGTCNVLNGSHSWWQTQKPYREPRINRIMTHAGMPSLHGFNGNTNFCRAGESARVKNDFDVSDSIFFSIAIQDFAPNDDITVRVYRPDNTQLHSFIASNGSVSSTRYFAGSGIKLSSAATSGVYRVNASYNGNTVNHYFTVNCVSDYTLSSQTGSYGRIASSHITTTAVAASGDLIKLQAASYIEFKPGFHAPAGTQLKARIRSCNYSE